MCEIVFDKDKGWIDIKKNVNRYFECIDKENEKYLKKNLKKQIYIVQ